jgi:hypothetical protein
VESRNELTSHPLQDPAPYKEDSFSGITSHALAPRSIPEALARSDAAHWKEAIDQEIMSCIKYQVWEECTLPKGKHALPCFFIFARKRDGRYKARLVAGGHRECPGLNLGKHMPPYALITH